MGFIEQNLQIERAPFSVRHSHWDVPDRVQDLRTDPGWLARAERLERHTLAPERWQCAWCGAENLPECVDLLVCRECQSRRSGPDWAVTWTPPYMADGICCFIVSARSGACLESELVAFRTSLQGDELGLLILLHRFFACVGTLHRVSERQAALLGRLVRLRLSRGRSRSRRQKIGE